MEILLGLFSLIILIMVGSSLWLALVTIVTKLVSKKDNHHNIKSKRRFTAENYNIYSDEYKKEIEEENKEYEKY